MNTTRTRNGTTDGRPPAGGPTGSGPTGRGLTDASPGHAGLAGAFGAEWTKLWSVRAPYICLLAALAVTGVFTYYYGSIARINAHPVQPLGNAPVSSAVLVQFAVVVLAMTTVTSEYTTSGIRASLLWVPVRHRVLLAKALLTAAVSFAAGTVSAVLGMAVAWAPFSGHASFDAALATRQTLAVGGYYALVAVLTVGVSFATRHAAGALTILVTLLWALPTTLLALGGPALLAVHDLLPHSLGSHLMHGGPDTPHPPGVAVLLLAAWALAAHLTGRYLLLRRDA
ncbi:ABC transporter permease [Streptomyces sp. NBC_00250]|uniref:ABC transporter permease n=1 Tax=Streptomyces sp. NBC_00250 TaxID=2903641 RepID=UPI002E29D959|nr:ABC transporter permease [Streptomyces sp. NBC_00250]